MLKINMELIKYKNADATTRHIIFQNFRNFRKNEKIEEFQDFLEFYVFFFSKNSFFVQEALYESSVRKPG